MIIYSARKATIYNNKCLLALLNDIYSAKMIFGPLNVTFWHHGAFKMQGFDPSQQLNGYISINLLLTDSMGKGEIVYQLKWHIWNFWNLKD